MEELKVISDFYDFMLWLIQHTVQFHRPVFATGRPARNRTAHGPSGRGLKVLAPLLSRGLSLRGRIHAVRRAGLVGHAPNAPPGVCGFPASAPCHTPARRTGHLTPSSALTSASIEAEGRLSLPVAFRLILWDNPPIAVDAFEEGRGHGRAGL